jgi:hypothetical protein
MENNDAKSTRKKGNGAPDRIRTRDFCLRAICLEVIYLILFKC